MAGLKRTDACAMCTVKDAQLMTLKAQLREYKKQLDQIKVEPMQNALGGESSEEGGPHKRRRVSTVSDGSEDDSEEEFLSSSPRLFTTQNRPKLLSGAGKKAQPTREEKRRAKAAEQQAKEVRKAVQAFKLQAGPIMKEEMAWKKRGRPFNFSLDISEGVFRALVSNVEIATSNSRSHYSKGAKLLTAELDQEDVVTVFGVGRSQQKYRMGSVGVITSMTLEYCSGAVEVHARWSL